MKKRELRARIAELESRLRNCDEYTDVAALRDRIAGLTLRTTEKNRDEWSKEAYAARAEVEHVKQEGSEYAATLEAEVERLKIELAERVTAHEVDSRALNYWHKTGMGESERASKAEADVRAMRPVVEAAGFVHDRMHADDLAKKSAVMALCAVYATYSAAKPENGFIGPYCAHCGGQHLGIDCPVQYPLPTDLDSEANRMAYDAPPPDGAHNEHEFTCPYCGSHGFGTTEPLGGKSCKYCINDKCSWSELTDIDLHLREATRHHELLEDYRKAAEDWQDTVDELREENSRLTARLVSMGDTGSDDVSVAVDGAPDRAIADESHARDLERNRRRAIEQELDEAYTELGAVLSAVRRAQSVLRAALEADHG